MLKLEQVEMFLLIWGEKQKVFSVSVLSFPFPPLVASQSGEQLKADVTDVIAPALILQGSLTFLNSHERG